MESMVIMEDIFGQLPSFDLPLSEDPEFSLDIDLNPKEMMDLEELNFDFEEINDLGSWIATSSDEDNSADVNTSENSETTSDRLNFEDLDIKEAVRYDCMWSSYNEFNAKKSAKAITTDTDNTLNLSTSFYDSLLGSIDTPSSSDCSDSCSVRSEMETDEDEEKSLKKISRGEKEKQSVVKSAHLITSLDHCYNISSTHLDNEHFLPKSAPLTPPVSSDDDEPTSVANKAFTFSNSCSNHNIRNQNTKHKRIITTSAKNHSKSLLKPMNRQRTTSEAKFSFKLGVNLKTNSDKSRSLLKQKVKIVRTPFTNKTSSTESQLKKKLFGEHRTTQSAMRKRRERSLKMQEGEAREVHNQMERQRRNELKSAFDELKLHLPDIASSDKASKQQILDKAVDTCLTVRNRESSLKGKVTNMTKTNSQLKEKLRHLQAEAKRREDFKLGIQDW